MLSREKPLVKPMAPGSLFHIIESRLHLASFRSIILQYLLSNLYIKNTKNIYFIIIYQISLLWVTVKGLTTPLSHWLQGSWLFVHVLGDWYVSNVSTFPNTFALVLDSNLHDVNETNPDWHCFQQNYHGVIFCADNKSSQNDLKIHKDYFWKI